MKENIKISVIIPVYNVQDYLAKCLDSIVNQTYKNLEIIVVNDCTPDNSQEIIDEYVKNDKRIVPIIHKKNKGLGGARNTGIDTATGNYIAFVDSDDYLALNTFELIVEKLNNYPNMDIVKFGRVEDYGDKKVKLSPKLSKDYYEDGWESIKDALYAKKHRVSACENIYSVNLLRENNIRFVEKLLYEDAYFSFKSQVLSSGLLILDEYLYFYKKDREDSIINTVSKRDIEVLKTIEMLEEFLISIDRDDIRLSYEYQWLIYDWVCYNTLYSYQQKKGKEDIKNQVTKTIIEHPIFRRYLIYLSKNAKFKRHKIPTVLLLNNMFLFKLFVKSFFTIKKLR